MASKSVRVKIDKAGIGALLRAPELRAQLTARMSRVLAAAQAGAVVGETGDYSRSFRLESVTTDRAVVRVVNTSDHAMFVEARTGNLARALDRAA